MTTDAAIERLRHLQPFERSGMRPGLERIEALLDRLDRPEADLRILHVGGTNGKGSVSALAEAILRAAGRRTGLYTSPHLRHLAERIRIDGAPIVAEALARQVDRLGDALDAVTFFEAMTAAALGAFREAAVDVAVLEVGLGGRWDATNVGAPLASVITRVDYDHQEYLGDRLEEIAAEKAAIIRGGVALSAAQAPEALAVIEARCRDLGVPLLVEGRDLRAEVVRSDLHGQRLDIRLVAVPAACGLRDTAPSRAGLGWGLRDVDLALLGLFQPANAALAVGAVRAVAEAAGFEVSDAAVRAGCAGVRWPGRFQVIPAAAGRPTVVLDGAHNGGGAAALAASLAHYFPGARLTLVLGISADKDRAGILKALVPLATRVVLTSAAHPRATPPAELAAALPPLDARVTLAPDVGAALDAAMSAPAVEVVCVAGSLFLVGDALGWLESHGGLDPQGA
ncbi:MAG TPA: folylpolyglutamate synthase/dihydrofolate synthase family protein [Methylomirabilota bacterium]|nr:folylpolyglutamate synthase/dihydrofolate synthase family protein [Methylomirabilota bacterium]